MKTSHSRVVELFCGDKYSMENIVTSPEMQTLIDFVQGDKKKDLTWKDPEDYKKDVSWSRTLPRRLCFGVGILNVGLILGPLTGRHLMRNAGPR